MSPIILMDGFWFCMMLVVAIALQVLPHEIKDFGSYVQCNWCHQASHSGAQVCSGNNLGRT